MSDLPVLGVAELRQHFKSGKASLLDAFRAAAPTVAAASRLMRQLAGHVDRTLAMLWSQAGLPPGAALLAVEIGRASCRERVYVLV